MGCFGLRVVFYLHPDADANRPAAPFTEAAKNAQDASQKLYLCVYLHRRQEEEKGAPIYEEAMVVETGERSFDVIVPRYGLEKRVWLEDLVDDDEIVGSAYDADTMKLKVAWRKKETTLADFLVVPSEGRAGSGGGGAIQAGDAPANVVAPALVEPPSETAAENIDTVNEEALGGSEGSLEAPEAEKPPRESTPGGLTPVIRRMEQIAVQLTDEAASSSGFESDVSSEGVSGSTGGLPGEAKPHLPTTPTSNRLAALKPPTPFLTPFGRDIDQGILSEVNRVAEFAGEETEEERALRTPSKVVPPLPVTPATAPTTGSRRGTAAASATTTPSAKSPNRVVQEIAVFSRLLVRLEVLMRKSPPDIKVFAVHPTTEAQLRADGKFEPIVHESNAVSFLRSQTGGALVDRPTVADIKGVAQAIEGVAEVSNVYAQGGEEH